MTYSEGEPVRRTIKINNEYANLVPDLSTQEYESLKQSIKENGQYVSIIINSQGVLLDGHSRFRVCQELGIEPNTFVRNFENKFYEQLFVIDCNLKRRQLNNFQRTELALKAKPILEEIAKKNESLGGKGVKHLTPLNRVDKGIGNRSEVSHETVRKVGVVLEKAQEKVKDDVRKGKISINSAYNSVKRAQDHRETPKLSENKYDIILADPPWGYELNKRISPDEHSRRMSKKEISQLHIPSADDSILFLWATNHKLFEALEVMKAWGFEYKANIVWIKSQSEACSYVKGKHELLLLGKKGNMLIPEEDNRPESVIEISNNPEESSKPTTIYNIIEKMYPNCKYLELFAGAMISEYKNDWDVRYDKKGKDILQSYYGTISDAIQDLQSSLVDVQK